MKHHLEDDEIDRQLSIRYVTWTAHFWVLRGVPHKGTIQLHDFVRVRACVCVCVCVCVCEAYIYIKKITRKCIYLYIEFYYI
jgi:hypothetical protein